MSDGSDYLDGIIVQLRQDNRQKWRRFSSILAAFGYSRRRQSVVDRINEEILRKGLRTSPPITSSLDIRSSVMFSFIDKEDVKGQAVESDFEEERSDDEEELRTVIETSITVGDLEAAERQPVCVSPDSTVKEAITLMELHDYSQVVVSTGIRSVKGVVSFRSIARAQLKGAVSHVRECIEDGIPEADLETPLLDVVKQFGDSDVVIIYKKDRSISGLVTPADIAKEFGGMAEPFFLIGEIENLLKWLIRKRKLNIEEFLEDDLKEKGTLERVEFLALGNIERVLQQEKAWEELSVPYDRKRVVDALEGVREVRNAAMHFRETLTVEQRDELRRFLLFLRRMCVGVEKEMERAV